MEYVRLTSEIPSKPGKYVILDPVSGKIHINEVKSDFDIYLDTCQQIVDDLSDQANPYLALSQYLRMNVYNGTTWDTACGKLDSTIKTRLDEKYSEFAKTLQVQTYKGDLLDVPHFWAVINGLYKGNGDLCGWAGDLVTFAADLKQNSELEFPALSFNEEDWQADADAYNIFNREGTDLIAKMKTYMSSVNEKLRINEFIKGGENVLNRYNSSSNKFLLSLLAAKSSVSATDISLAASKMQTYIDKNKN